MTRFKTFDEVEEKRHPDESIYHEIVWWISKPLTLEQWSKLDDLMCNVFEEIGLEDEYSGWAGPIPFDEWYEEAKKTYDGTT